jgi:hypothetical protein
MDLRMNFQQRVTIAPDVLFRTFSNEAVLLNLETEMYFELDEVGTHMWQLLADSGTIQAAYEALMAEYDVEPAQLKEDMISLLNQLTENQLIMLQDD